ncbi:MAG: glutamate--tRNA ligase [Erysipelotrichaceae bacterium]|nr:glutamate--tRNA ligase [Erysipelotrichaceae bacterium]
MATLKDLANLIFPNVNETIEDLEKRYPLRNLEEGSEVTRFAPSPTGFLHTGSLFTTLVTQKVANQSNGVFFIRLEDTDTKREIAGSGKELIDQLSVFGVVPNEGYMGDFEKGNYGPYKQSQRAHIYNVVIKDLITRGRAYPCFCSHEDLDELRKVQEAKKLIPGYYGEFAKCRNLSVEEQIKLVKEGKPFVIRFKSLGNHENKVEVDDLVRGHLLLSENDQDIVIYKSDGLPTYHFAHLVDDHFMRTTCVTRGEEWLPSLPIHIDLFNTMGWKAPKYAHLPVIMKNDNGTRRKLSKRKDNEAACSYFLQDGYPVYAFKQYLFTIANSNYEEWQRDNKELKLSDFNFQFNKMSLDGALFDIDKLKYFSKELLASYSGEEMKEFAKEYAKKYNDELYQLIIRDEDYFTQIMSIEKDKENPRKDYEKCADILEKVKFFYEPYFSNMMENGLPYNENIDKKIISKVLQEFVDTLNYEVSEQEWFNNLKALAVRNNFAESAKIYKQNKELYLGSVNDIAEMVRISLTTSKQSPNIYYVLRILGKEEIARRISKSIEVLNK